MKRKFLPLLLFVLFQLLILNSKSNNSIKYQPLETVIYYKLGQSIVPLRIFQYGEAKDLVMINLHDDEMTSVNAGQQFLEKHGGLMIKIENNNKRNIRFKLAGRNYTFDPNRIFSRQGISKSLEELSVLNNTAIDEIEKFANRILQLIPENPSCIIALHNNTEGQYSIASYFRGNKREKDAKKVYANSLQDEDDLFLTTDSLLYHRLTGENYNCILQDNEKANKDGSLSVYCGERNIRYLNCETQHGKTLQHFEMLIKAANYIKRENPDIVIYSFKLAALPRMNGETLPAIYFGEKKIGIIKSMDVFDNEVHGKMEIDKKFRLNSNADFFLFQNNDQMKFEMRIDPTREKKQLDPNKDVIEIITRK